jgi:hypothetical protein
MIIESMKKDGEMLHSIAPFSLKKNPELKKTAEFTIP